MKAFVRTKNGKFPDVNYYLAAEGFENLGYNVTLFEGDDISQITTGSPAFAGHSCFRKILDKLKVDYSFNCYPEELKQFYGREIRKSTIANSKEIGKFIKPVLQKKFGGTKINKGNLQFLSAIHLPQDTEVYVSDIINIVSEFRAYVYSGETEAVKHYRKEWNKIPDESFIEDAIKQYTSCPIAYGIDFAVLDTGKTVVLEVNDACNLGNYGLDSSLYANMIASRWNEITQTKEKHEEFLARKETG